jgi:hypothetical protein
LGHFSPPAPTPSLTTPHVFYRETISIHEDFTLKINLFTFQSLHFLTAIQWKL